MGPLTDDRTLLFTDSGSIDPTGITVFSLPECVWTGIIAGVCSADHQRRIDADLGDGDDSVDASRVPVRPAPSDPRISRESGRWSLGAGSDRFVGGPGDDWVTPDEPGQPLAADDVFGGGGAGDTVFYSGHTAPVTVTLDDAPNDGAPGEGDNIRADVERIWGTPYADTLVGSDAANFFLGQGGADVLQGGRGPDVLNGGHGGVADGGDGNDLIRLALGGHALGGAGDDEINTGDGFVNGTSPPHVVECGPGHDTVRALVIDTVASNCEDVTLRPLP